MELTSKLGQKIINETKKLINEDIIILNERAIIIASTDSSRIGDFHEGAFLTIQNNSTTILSEKHVQKLEGIRPGVNLPITIKNNVIGVIGITGDPDKIIPFASVMKKMTELLIRENIYVQETEWHARAVEAYFFDWIQMEELTKEFINRGNILGVDIPPPFRCTIIDIKQELPNNQIKEILSLLRLKIECIAIRWGNNRILLLTEEKHYELHQLKSQLHSLQSYVSATLGIKILSIGIGTRSDSFFLKESYQRAIKAQSIGKQGAITAYDDLLLEICFDEIGIEVKEVFVNRVFSSLLNEEPLFQTLKVLLRNNMNLKHTAKELHIHINTLHYRLSRIEQLTGYNPKNTYSITLFYMGLHFLDKNLK
ncbi:sugar diacid recognition domain-containing protein [Paucisalibacillus sp. EB02]|uniref:CdaR family transcriptional regulator n=1 Tax=Paucisalibacillus sp. EB02 TaxID=1347087 RepID=UPI0004AD2A74|nr:sugar diacid recognition domain-containing protein [Paucisalibacillus sp. EB02]